MWNTYILYVLVEIRQLLNEISSFPEVLYKRSALVFPNQPFIDHLQNRCSRIIHKIDSKKPVLESLFNKVAVLRACNFIKEDFDIGDFLWNFQTF